jgi:hypothetical protein
MSRKLVRFGWAIKKLLRHKANFGILEGFLSELLRFDVAIESVLESEGKRNVAPKQDEYDKYNRVDILVKSQNDELLLIEVQNDPEADYFLRRLFGVSKLVTEYLKESEPYGTIKKIYSVNIVYFGLGRAGTTCTSTGAALWACTRTTPCCPPPLQRQGFEVEKVADIFPKYYILKVNNFNDVAKDTLDEWVYFLKNSEVKDGFRAKGLDKAKEKLRYEALTDEEKKMYDRFQENRRIENSVNYTAKQEKAIEIAKVMLGDNEPDERVARYTGLTLEHIAQLRSEKA